MAAQRDEHRPGAAGRLAIGETSVAIAVSALLTAASREGNRLRAVLGVAGLLWATMCIAVTVVQVGTWKDNRTLYGHAVALVPQSSMAH